MSLFEKFNKAVDTANQETLNSGIDVVYISNEGENPDEEKKVAEALEGSRHNILASKAAKDDVNFNHVDLYFTVTGYAKGDSTEFSFKDSNERAYAKRRLHGRGQNGRSTVVFYHQYQDEGLSLEKGAVVTLRAIEIPTGGSLVQRSYEGEGENRKSVISVATYKKGGWCAFTPFGHKTSVQELLISASAVQTNLKKQTADATL